MIRLVLTFMAMLALNACTAMGVYDGDRRFAGVVEQVRHVSRPGQPPLILMGLGAIGGLAYGEMKKPTETNLYVVSTADGARITAQTDDDFAVGDCVEIIPSKNARISNGYTYGDARIVKARGCTAPPAPAPTTAE